MNNKGITLIEIIISIVLISIVLIFLFSLLVTVNDINYESEVNSTYLINKSLILKNIEEDFEKAKEIKLESCNIYDEDFYPNYPDNNIDPNYFKKNNGSYDTNLTYNKCLKLIYTIEEPNPSDPYNPISSNSNAYLGIYYYKTKEQYVISYIHGSTKSTRILPGFENSEYNRKSLEISTSTEEFTTWKHNDNDINFTYLVGGVELVSGFHNIYIPIIGKDGKDYSLNISYYKE